MTSSGSESKNLFWTEMQVGTIWWWLSFVIHDYVLPGTSRVKIIPVIILWRLFPSLAAIPPTSWKWAPFSFIHCLLPTFSQPSEELVLGSIWDRELAENRKQSPYTRIHVFFWFHHGEIFLVFIGIINSSDSP